MTDVILERVLRHTVLIINLHQNLETPILRIVILANPVSNADPFIPSYQTLRCCMVVSRVSDAAPGL